MHHCLPTCEPDTTNNKNKKHRPVQNRAVLISVVIFHAQLVAVVFRLERAIWRNTDISGLLWIKLGQLYANPV